MRLTLLFLTGAAILAAQQKRDFVYQGAPTTMAFVAGELVGGPAVTGAPYSAEAVTETTQVLGDGNRIVNKQTAKIYRNSAGMERREQSIPKLGNLTPDGEAPMTIMISDPVGKV